MKGGVPRGGLKARFIGKDTGFQHGSSTSITLKVTNG